jgi:hypothetical protein
MQTTRQRCPIHNIPLARRFEMNKMKKTDSYRWEGVQYHCRVCRALERTKVDLEESVQIHRIFKK